MKELNKNGTTTSEIGVISTNNHMAKKQWNTPKLMEVDYQHTFASTGSGLDGGTYS